MSVKSDAMLGAPKVAEDSGRAVDTPKRFNKIILLAALAIILNALYNYSVASRNSYNEMLKVGDKLPPFKLELVDGGSVTEKNFLGKPTAYFFYAEWCPCSHFSVDWIKRSRQDGRFEGINMVGVGIQDGPEKLKKFARRYQLDFPVSHIGGEKMARSIGVKVTPTTIFTDSEGVIRSVFVGKIEKYEQLTEGLNVIAPSAAKAVSS